MSLLWIEHSTSRYRSVEPKFAAQGRLLQSGALPSELKRLFLIRLKMLKTSINLFYIKAKSKACQREENVGCSILFVDVPGPFFLVGMDEWVLPKSHLDGLDQ